MENDEKEEIDGTLPESWDIVGISPITIEESRRRIPSRLRYRA